MAQNKEHLQAKYQELQMLDQQMKLLQQQGQMLEKQLLDLEKVKEALDDFKKTGKDEMLVPLSEGIYAKGKLEENDHLVVNVGAGTFVEKSVDDVKQILEKQTEELNQMQGEMAANTKKLAEQGISLQEELSQLMK